jgi:hypothetical protein
MAATQPILDLSTTHKRLTVKVDGVAYDLRGKRDLVLRDYKAVDRVMPRISELESKDALSDEESEEYSELSRQLCRIAMDAPDAVIDRLDESQKSAVARAFLGDSLGLMLIPTPAVAPPSSPSNGVKPSPASPGSTGSTPRRGTRASRTGSSRRT